MISYWYFHYQVPPRVLSHDNGVMTRAGGEERTNGHHGLNVNEERAGQLARFLRSRRERVTPESVGLLPNTRRRTPGLRREELAQLANVGVTWYTWLEQGRPIKASAHVLDSIAQALRLDSHERRHLFTLGQVTDPVPPVMAEEVPPALQDVVDALGSCPATVVNARWDVIAYNRSQAALLGDYATVPPGRRNNMWLLFTEPSWRRILPDWDLDASRVLGQYRAAMADSPGDPAWTDLVDELSMRSPEFRKRWEQQDIAGPTNRVKRFLHPEVGSLRVNSTSLWLGGRSAARLIVYTPADDESRAALDRLSAVTPRPLSGG